MSNQLFLHSSAELLQAWQATPQSKHPEAIPSDTPWDMPGLYNPPNWRSETSWWERWLESSRRFLAHHPKSIQARTMVEQAEAALAYRATVPEDQIYWRRERPTAQPQGTSAPGTAHQLSAAKPGRLRDGA
ncbi:hypothetical protein [Indioceanicola profundi]|uniref:hypothetical protein n=1 Tax=Indioceanicola profundi TaxID=2220096 RepID=UPI0013C48579|nr:hypothetical protein [Indioceanicola profundi]